MASIFGIPNIPGHIAEISSGEGAFGQANTAVSNGQIYIAGFNSVYDVTVPQNVGIYYLEHTQPGDVLPDRFNDKPPLASQEARKDTAGVEPRKGELLRLKMSQ